jgi:hypothetical protein
MGTLVLETQIHPSRRRTAPVLSSLNVSRARACVTFRWMAQRQSLKKNVKGL